MIFFKGSKTKDYYSDTKDEKHIFIYSVAGRTGSTALQRILNSSDKICIWGESWGEDNKILDAIRKLQELEKMWKGSAREMQYKYLLSSFKKNKHDVFYPLAFKDSTKTINRLCNVLAKLLQPPKTRIKRYGVKSITAPGGNILRTLRRIYPNCYLIFCFRNPVQQWLSVKNSQYWDYSKSLDDFIDEYLRLSNRYIKLYQSDLENCFFIENKKLFEKEFFDALLPFLDLEKYDTSLIGKIVGSTSDGKIAEADKKKITESEAYANYRRMKKLSLKFAAAS